MHILLTHSQANQVEHLVELRDLLAQTNMQVLTLQIQKSASSHPALKQVPEAGPEHPVYISQLTAAENLDIVFKKNLVQKETVVLTVNPSLSCSKQIALQALKQEQTCLHLHLTTDSPPWQMDLAVDVCALILSTPPPSPCELTLSLSDTQRSFSLAKGTHGTEKNRDPLISELLTIWLAELIDAAQQRLTFIEPCSCCNNTHQAQPSFQSKESISHDHH